MEPSGEGRPECCKSDPRVPSEGRAGVRIRVIQGGKGGTNKAESEGTLAGLEGLCKVQATCQCMLHQQMRGIQHNNLCKVGDSHNDFFKCKQLKLLHEQDYF